MPERKPPIRRPSGTAPLEIAPEAWRSLGHTLVDQIADFLKELPQRPVTPGEQAGAVRHLVGGTPLPTHGGDPEQLLGDAARLLFDHSLFNGHPRFWGYVTSSAAPIGALADLLAAAVNPNVGAWTLSPVASAIEEQTVRWIAELMGYPADCGGLLVSGGNAANFVGLLAARSAQAGWDVRATGVTQDDRRLVMYASRATHTWLEKAADLFGFGTDAIRWIPVDEQERIDVAALRQAIAADHATSAVPFMIVGTAGTVSTGAVDPLTELAAIAREHGLWFHVDGAYGGLAAALLDARDVADVPDDLRGLREADSVAVDPHKWLYAPLEAGCALVRNRAALRDTFSFHPAYYHFNGGEDEPGMNYYEYGLQNSRGFRALKVWLGLKQAGRIGYEQLISDDIRLAQAMDRYVRQQPELEPHSQRLSITTFRYVPRDLQPGTPATADYLNQLNTEILDRIQRGGAAFVSNAVLDGRYVLRACIVNFRTTDDDVAALPQLVVATGREVDAELRPSSGLRKA